MNKIKTVVHLTAAFGTFFNRLKFVKTFQPMLILSKCQKSVYFKLIYNFGSALPSPTHLHKDTGVQMIFFCNMLAPPSVVIIFFISIMFNGYSITS